MPGIEEDRQMGPKMKDKRGRKKRTGHLYKRANKIIKKLKRTGFQQTRGTAVVFSQGAQKDTPIPTPLGEPFQVNKNLKRININVIDRNEEQRLKYYSIYVGKMCMCSLSDDIIYIHFVKNNVRTFNQFMNCLLYLHNVQC